MSKEEFTVEDSIAGVAAAITLNYDMLLGILQDHIKREYVSAVEDVNPGATAYLEEEAAGIWNAAMKVVLDRWLATVRPNPDDARQVETVARALCRQAGYDPGATTEGPGTPLNWTRFDDRARAVLTALAEAVK